MLLQLETKESLDNFLKSLKLKNQNYKTGKDKEAKIEQILAYLEVIHSKFRKYSKNRELVFIESGAGNCYLSFLVYYFYTRIEKRKIRIHCLDINGRLMEKNRQLAEEHGFDKMYFHACDIIDYTHQGKVDLVYSLHACDSATDKTIYLGCKSGASHILSVSCCQHSIKKQMRGGAYSSMTKHRVFKDRLLYMVSDSLRSLLLQKQGYDTDIIEFVSSRYTDKNVMIRARKGREYDQHEIQEEYNRLHDEFNVTPALAGYLDHR